MQQSLQFAVDTSIPFTEHFVKYGFAVLKGLVDRSFCADAVDEIRRIVDDERPLEQWTTEKPGVASKAFFDDPGRDEPTKNSILEKVFDQPRLRAAIDELHGSPDRWDGVRNYYVLVKPFDPNGRPELNLHMFHLDFGFSPPPTLYRGFLFMVSLVDTEPFSGNFTCRPASHRVAQKVFIDHPDIHGNDSKIRDAVCDGLPVYEFVAEAGDVLLWHHLLYHEGNPSHSKNRKPRLALLCEALREKWLTTIDAAAPNLSPWERSLAHNGSHKPARNEARFECEKRAARLAGCEAKGMRIETKWRTYSDWPAEIDDSG
jgi:hypothetical protein